MSQNGMPSEGWAVELCGERFDLDDLREMLAPPFDPWVEEYQDGDQVRLLLRSSAWSTADDSTVLAARVRQMVECLNGAKPLTNEDSVPVTIGLFFKFDENGTRVPFLMAMAGHCTLTGLRARGRISTTSDLPAPPPQPSQLQNWLKLAETDEKRADLFAHITRGDNWYDLYKAAEIIRRIAGEELKVVLGSGYSEWERVWRTANSNRHARDPIKNRPPRMPATLAEARKTVLLAAKLVV